MNDFLKPNVQQINFPNITQTPSFIAAQEAIQRVGVENEEVRHITINSTAAHTAEYIYKSILEFSEIIDDSYDVGIQVTTLGVERQTLVRSNCKLFSG